MGSDADRGEKDYTSYRLLVDLWARENPIKTAKLLVLLATNALLIAAVSVAGGLVPENWPLCLAGAAFSLVWALSLGRTALFQEGWRLKIREIAARYPADARFQVLEATGEREKSPFLIRVMGAVPSVYYLLGTPVLLLLWWLGALATLVF
ncbi:MAG: hypothetical protein LUQ32_01715 [Methanomicrobiales archaeon]|nr:hypothetical protein [Methanomicrobiales archaeon]